LSYKKVKLAHKGHRLEGMEENHIASNGSQQTSVFKEEEKEV